MGQEIEAGQERGEIATGGRPETVPYGNGIPITLPDLGLTRKEAAGIGSPKARNPTSPSPAAPSIDRTAIPTRRSRSGIECLQIRTKGTERLSVLNLPEQILSDIPPRPPTREGASSPSELTCRYSIGRPEVVSDSCSKAIAAAR